MIKLSGSSISSFQWSENEQVWPFEKALDGSTLYCKEVDCGSVPSTGQNFVNHNISNLTGDKIHRAEGLMYGSNADGYIYAPLTYASTSSAYTVLYQISATQILIASGNNYWAGFIARVRLIYKK